MSLGGGTPNLEEASSGVQPKAVRIVPETVVPAIACRSFAAIRPDHGHVGPTSKELTALASSYLPAFIVLAAVRGGLPTR